MTQSRLSLALEQGSFALPDGTLAVWNPAADLDLDFAPLDQLHLIQGFAPAHDALAARGAEVGVESNRETISSVVFCHRAKAASFAALAEALTRTVPGGLIAVEGAKTDGIEPILKALKARFDGVDSYSKAHGKLAWFTRPDVLPDLTDWQRKPTQLPGGFTTYPGVFSADGIDKGSALLAQHLPKLKGAVADFGAGWGYLSRQILTNEAVKSLDLIEADHLALAAARLNVTDPRAAFHWADIASFKGGLYDAIICNPPFHNTRTPSPELGQMFITRARAMLSPKGQFWMVANRNLPYEQTLTDSFAQVDSIAQTGGFKIICARRPKSQKQSARKGH